VGYLIIFHSSRKYLKVIIVVREYKTEIRVCCYLFCLKKFSPFTHKHKAKLKHDANICQHACSENIALSVMEKNNAIIFDVSA